MSSLPSESWSALTAMVKIADVITGINVIQLNMHTL